ncbi:hypothetical protein [Chitinophaga rhizophila]|uniref:Uncharacterized protein n=1 Tax=Chitinophaga rhizophila TaxID=2866212 RepID=A0ABS7GLE7_9BACT|nr:hypothetical protein [Chitinophaga rhizophila]MBW8688171.1 hypothetical protein [Chitinophaga rhizophila]
MAQSTDNVLLKGASGTIGDQITITRRKSGKTIMGKKRRSSDLPPTDKQLVIQQRFKAAIQYAKAVLADPVKKAMYAAFAGPDQSAYNMAMRDAFKAPVVDSIDTTNYQGRTGNPVIIQASDDFKVTTVKVIIRTNAGAVIEEGEATLQDNGLDWLYTATVNNASLTGSVITAVAVDTPGNETSRERVL